MCVCVSKREEKLLAKYRQSNSDEANKMSEIKSAKHKNLLHMKVNRNTHNRVHIFDIREARAHKKETEVRV